MFLSPCFLKNIQRALYETGNFINAFNNTPLPGNGLFKLMQITVKKAQNLFYNFNLCILKMNQNESKQSVVGEG